MLAGSINYFVVFVVGFVCVLNERSDAIICSSVDVSYTSYRKVELVTHLNAS